MLYSFALHRHIGERIKPEFASDIAAEHSVEALVAICARVGLPFEPAEILGISPEPAPHPS